VLAWLVDFAAIFALVAVFMALGAAISGIRAPSELEGLDGMMARLHALERVWVPSAALGAVLSLVYCAVGAFLFQGRTLGRALLGIRLVDTTGLSPTPVRAVVRAILATVSAVLCFAGFWWALFDRKGQALHDKLTATYVVRP
jgi:uncharacterized RDD family membrane protein YckC